MPTIGQLVLFVFLVLVFYDIFYSVTSYFGETLNQTETLIEEGLNATNSTTLFQNTYKVAKTVFQWQVFVLSSAAAFAVLLFIDLVREAFETGWQ